MMGGLQLGPGSGVVNIRGVCIQGGLHLLHSAGGGLHLGAWADPPLPGNVGYGRRVGSTHPTGMHSCYIWKQYVVSC